MVRYRGKHVVTGEWQYGFLIGKDIIGEVKYYAYLPGDDAIPGHAELESWCLVDPKTLGMATGKQDETGREIFGNDIIEIDGSTEVVEWIPSQCGFSPFCYQIPQAADSYSEWEYITKGKIIGNTHDHPNFKERGFRI